MKLFLKTIFVMAVLALLVMMGLNNRSSVSFALPPVLPKAISQQAALMYFAFFAVGFVTATIIRGSSGGKGGSSSGGASKPSKPKLVK